VSGYDTGASGRVRPEATVLCFTGAAGAVAAAVVVVCLFFLHAYSSACFGFYFGFLFLLILLTTYNLIFGIHIFYFSWFFFFMD
jgi:hypothetical protein